jgi:hypothetical protein
MTQDSLVDVQEDLPIIDENKNYFEELVGEGRKYRDQEALAKSRIHADRHIAIVEKQNEEYRKMALEFKEQADAGAKLQDLSNRIEEQLKQLASRETTPNSNEDNKPSVNLDDIESLVSNKIQQHTQNQKETENYNQVKSKLEEKYGENYKTVLKQKSKSLNMTDDEVNALARKNPNLFLKTFDLLEQQSVNFQSPPQSSGFNPKPAQKRTWSYYMEMKKKDPKAWLDRKIAIQMEKDSQALGSEFFDV